MFTAGLQRWAVAHQGLGDEVDTPLLHSGDLLLCGVVVDFLG